MGWVEGVVTVLTGWAWPVVALVAVLVLKKEIGKLITRLTRFSGAGVEAEFSEQVEAASDFAEAISPESPSELPAASVDGEAGPLATNPSLSDLMAETQVHPVGAMVRAWNLVETKAEQVIPSTGNWENARGRLSTLRAERRISPDLFHLGRRLFNLRSQVVHGDVVPTRDDATEFVNAAWRLASELSRLDPLPSTSPRLTEGHPQTSWDGD